MAYRKDQKVNSNFKYQFDCSKNIKIYKALKFNFSRSNSHSKLYSIHC